MAKSHYVTCVYCGKKFDAEKKGYYYDRNSRRYYCLPCYRKLTGGSPAGKTNEKLGQATWAFVVKLFVAALFLISAFTHIASEPGWFGPFMLLVVFAAALIFWAGFPIMKAKKKKAAEEQAEIERIEQTNAELRICPSCGAQTTGPNCEYCGTKLS